MTFKSDLRISVSSEAKLPQGWTPPPGSYVQQVRLKERYKFQFQFLVFDLTKT